MNTFFKLQFNYFPLIWMDLVARITITDFKKGI